MRVSPELLPTLNRFQDSQRLGTPQGAAEAFDKSLTDGRSAATLAAQQAKAQRVAAPVRAEAATARREEPGGPPAQDARFAREAPNGARPRYAPKGQMLNILV
jgi:hypothetical protein